MWKRVKKILIKILVGLLLLHVGQVLLFKWVNPLVTITQVGAMFDGHELQNDHVKIEDVSPNMMLAVIAAEDQLFAKHNGFDVDSIKKALVNNLEGKHTRGASTISQQVAKNLFLWQGRSWFRKGLEAYYTVIIEQLYGKKRILELYLNIAETGPGTFGVEAASKRYFNKPAKKLTAKEASLIAAILPSPKKRSPIKPTPHIRKKAKWIRSQFAYLKTRKETVKLLQ